MNFDAKIPGGPLEDKWARHLADLRLVSPANKRKFHLIVVGSGLAGASAAASLAELGYNRFVWFDKYGFFNHIMAGYNPATVRAQAVLCRQSKSLPSWHYDIIALHTDHDLSAVSVADLRRAIAHKVLVRPGMRRAPSIHR